MMQGKVIMYDSPEAATLKTVTGWVSSNGCFYGDNEHLARWGGCTHDKCECGELKEKHYTLCKECLTAKSREVYLSRPEKDLKDVDVFCLEDKYFFNVEDFLDYCAAEEIDPETAELEVCEPQYARLIDDDYFSDILPEDMTLDDCDTELAALIEAVNSYIAQSKKPISWIAGKFRTSYKPEQPHANT